jgi:hypothetical protein
MDLTYPPGLPEVRLTNTLDIFHAAGDNGEQQWEQVDH